MHLKQFTRLLQTSQSLLADIEKSTLAALRKKTGYTFSNCRKALEMHNNDIILAEKWLHKQAQSLGWSKASKLAERSTAQGLVGVLVRGNIGAMVEVNCETDFVARNEHFRNCVDHVARVCAQYTELTSFDGDLWKSGFEAEALKNLKSLDGKSLADHMALLIGNVGENANIKRAVCFKVNNDLHLAGYAHPQPTLLSSTQNITQMGKYGTIIAFRSHNQLQNGELEKNLCQHIIGLNPTRIGEEDKDEPNDNKDEEICLIHQEYLLDEERTVGDILRENNFEIVDYQRYECGEDVSKIMEFEQAKITN